MQQLHEMVAHLKLSDYASSLATYTTIVSTGMPTLQDMSSLVPSSFFKWKMIETRMAQIRLLASLAAPTVLGAVPKR